MVIFAVQNENQMKQYHIAAIGELNVDIILNGIESEPEIGKEKFARDMTVTLGSSTAIFAANAAALGSKVCFVEVHNIVQEEFFATTIAIFIYWQAQSTTNLLQLTNLTTT